MLLLAVWIGGHEAFIFEIELDFLPWLWEFQRFGLVATIRLRYSLLAAGFSRWASGSAAGAAGLRLPRRIAVQVVEDRLWPRNALQVLWGSDADFQDALDDGWLGGDGGWWRAACPRTGV